MRPKWTLILALVFLAVAIAAERVGSHHLSGLTEQRDRLEDQLAEAAARASHAAKERRRCEALLETVERIESRLVWEKDSTNLLRWFADTAAESGVKLISSKLLPKGREAASIAGGNFEPLTFELRLEGGYWPLVRYVERIETAPSPMWIQTATLNADRSQEGRGELRLTVVNLYPTQAGSDAGEEQT